MAKEKWMISVDTLELEDASMRLMNIASTYTLIVECLSERLSEGTKEGGEMCEAALAAMSAKSMCDPLFFIGSLLDELVKTVDAILSKGIARAAGTSGS